MKINLLLFNPVLKLKCLSVLTQFCRRNFFVVKQSSSVWCAPVWFLSLCIKKKFSKKFVAHWESCDRIDILLAKKVWKWLLRLIWLNCFNFKFSTIICLQLLSRTEIQDGNAYPATSHALPIPPIQAAGFVPAVLDLWDDRRPTETTRWTSQTFF